MTTIHESFRAMGFSEAEAEAAASGRWALSAPPGEGRRTPMRAKLHESRVLAEASKAGSILHLTVIRAGFNVPRSRYYTEEALRRGAEKFKGLKMFCNHQTAAEQRARPEGDVNQWVAVITEAKWDQATKRIRATASLIDPTFREKVSNLAAANLLTELGVSIRASGVGVDTDVEGTRTYRVDEIAFAESVDFVTEAGAGGMAELLESAGRPRPGTSQAGPRISESLAHMGMTPAQAAIAEAGRDARASTTSLQESFQAMGMSPEQAAIAAEGR